jgi:Fe2+ or Zn2+ uptake regulation protein
MHWSAEEVEVLLRERGLSLTPQRRAIVRCLSEHGGHWTAAELLARVAGDFPLASRATVYSTVGLLRDLGVLVALPALPGELRFDADPAPHQHFVCLRCGQLEDVPEGWFPIAPPPGITPTFQVHRYRVIAEGLCACCIQAS